MAIMVAMNLKFGLGFVGWDDFMLNKVSVIMGGDPTIEMRSYSAIATASSTAEQGRFKLRLRV